MDLLLKLDGLVHTMLLFQREDGSNLMVGVGKISFVVTFTSETQNLTLANLAPDEGCLLEICAGGQFGEYPSEIVVGFDAAASAVLHFFANDEKLLDELQVGIVFLGLKEFWIRWSHGVDFGGRRGTEVQWHSGSSFVLDDEVVLECRSLEACIRLLVEM